jgi:hypothetical protein
MNDLTPGERFNNWVDGVVKAWPIVLPLLAGTVWGNSEAVRNFVKGETLTPVDGISQPANGDFEAQVRTSIADIVDELKRLRAKDAQLQAQYQEQDIRNFDSLGLRLTQQQLEIESLRELVQ